MRHPPHDRRIGVDYIGFKELLHPGQAGLFLLVAPAPAGHDFAAPGYAAGVESPQGQLRPRLADALRRDDAHRLADFHQPPGGRQPPVAQLANAPPRLAGQRRPHRHAGHPGCPHRARQLVGNHLIPFHDDLAAARVGNHIAGHAPLDAVVNRAAVIIVPVAFHPVRLGEFAVVLPHDDLLRHIHQPAGGVAAGSGTQGGVGKRAPGAVGTDEILPGGKALAEAGLHRRGESLDFAPGAGEGHQPAHTGHLLNLGDVPLGAGVRHNRHAAIVGQPTPHLLLHLIGGVRPGADDLIIPFRLGHHPQHIAFLEVSHFAGGLGEDGFLVLRHLQVVDGNGNARLGGVVKAQLLDAIQDARRSLVVVELFVQLRRQVRQRAPVHQLVLEADRIRQRFVENQPAHSGFQLFRRAGSVEDGDGRPQPDGAVGVGNARLISIVKDAPAAGVSPAVAGVRLDVPAAVPVAFHLGQVVAAHHHIQVGRHQRVAGGGRQHIVDAQHHRVGFVHRHSGQRHVHRHLVAVKVGVESRADQRMQLDGAAFNQNRLESLDAQPVQRGRPVQHHRPVLDDILQNVPHLRRCPLHHPLGGADVRRQRVVHQPVHYERLEQLQRHFLGQAALVHFQLRPHHDNRPPGVVHPLAQQVLPKAPLLPLEQVAERLQLVVALALHRLALPPVVNQRIHRLLQHPLFVADHQAGRAHPQKPLQPVVAGQHPAVQVVEVAGGEPPPVQLHHRAQLRRQHRQDGHNHILRAVFAAPESFQQPYPLARLGADLRRGGPHLLLGKVPFLVQILIHQLEEIQYRFGSHIRVESVAPEGLEPLVPAGGQGSQVQTGPAAADDVELVRHFRFLFARRRQFQIIPDPFQIGGAQPLLVIPPQPAHRLHQLHRLLAPLRNGTL